MPWHDHDAVGDLAIRLNFHLPRSRRTGRVRYGEQERFARRLTIASSDLLLQIKSGVVVDDVLLDRCRTIAGFSAGEPCTGDALIGMLQRFRPSGQELEGLFQSLPMGEQLQLRLRQLYAAAGHSARPGGGQDAYFIVREPPELEPQRAAQFASDWLGAIGELATETGDGDLAGQLDPLPEIRVLQGIAPKQGKSDLQSFPLYRAIKQQAAELSKRLPADNGLSELLRPAYYFAACDWALRDYLLWPIYSEFSRLDDPFLPYFELWRHGVKWRAFADDRVDVYLPHSDR